MLTFAWNVGSVDIYRVGKEKNTALFSEIWKRKNMEKKSRIFREFGLELLYSLDSGKKFEEALRVYPIFTKELSLIVEYGELKSKLGQELMVFSEESWSRFFERIERAMQLIQPLVFLIVAVLIILIYVAMLLPIYNNMGSVM